MKRSAMKRSQPKRDWTEARAKVNAENECRYYRSDLGCAGALEAAHIIGREHDLVPHSNATVRVHGVRIVPLCRIHHERFDSHELDLLPCLTLDEQVQAVRDAGGIELARKRLAPSQYRREQC